MTTESAKPIRRHRFVRFSLRTLLTAITLVAVSLGFWVRGAHKQRNAITAIRAAGGKVAYEYQSESNRQTYGKLGWLHIPQKLHDALGDDYFQNATRVYVPGATDEVMKAVGKLDAIQLLRANSSTHVTDAGVAELAGMHNIYQLELNSDYITDRSLRTIGGLGQLDILDLPGFGARREKITNQGLGYLARLKKLRILRLTNTAIDDGGLSKLATMPLLSDLDLSGSKITGNGLVLFSRSSAIRSLNLSNTPFDDAGLAQLERFSALDTLNLKNTKISDAGLACLLKLDSLERLELDGTVVTDTIWPILAQMPRLQHLSLSGTKITGRGIAAIGRQIQYMDLSNTSVDDAAIDSLQSNHMFGLELAGLQLDGTKVSASKVQALLQIWPFEQSVNGDR